MSTAALTALSAFLKAAQKASPTISNTNPSLDSIALVYILL
jgi:hypothetical protein